MTMWIQKHIKNLLSLSFGLAQLIIILLLAKFLAEFIPLPASIIGLIICCSYCVVLKGIPPSLELAGGLLLQYMPLFFIPLIVGLPLYWQELQSVWFICLIALVVSTVISMIVSAKLTDKRLEKQE